MNLEIQNVLLIGRHAYNTNNTISEIYDTTAGLQVTTDAFIVEEIRDSSDGQQVEPIMSLERKKGIILG